MCSCKKDKFNISKRKDPTLVPASQASLKLCAKQRAPEDKILAMLCLRPACFWCQILRKVKLPIRPIYLHKICFALLYSSFWSPKNTGEQMLYINLVINLVYQLGLTVKNNVSFQPSWLVTGFENIFEKVLRVTLSSMSPFSVHRQLLMKLGKF